MRSSQTEFSSKAEARAYFKQVRKDLTDAERAELDRAICEQLERYVSADTVLLFYPVKGEPNILPFAESLFKKGVRVAFPISITDTCELDFRYVERLGDMEAGTYGIPEPSKSAKKARLIGECVCVVPALAFDGRGTRIGYGKGYYDRFLAGARVRSVGVSYSACTCEALPSNKNDICVDTIITEKGVTRSDAKK